MKEALDVGDMDSAVGKNVPKKVRTVRVRIGKRKGFREYFPVFVCSLQPPVPTCKQQPPTP